MRGAAAERVAAAEVLLRAACFSTATALGLHSGERAVRAADRRRAALEMRGGTNKGSQGPLRHRG